LLSNNEIASNLKKITAQLKLDWWVFESQGSSPTFHQKKKRRRRRRERNVRSTKFLSRYEYQDDVELIHWR
jgi:hypothetical protein